MSFAEMSRFALNLSQIRESRITSISSAASSPFASQEPRRPCTLSSSPFVSRDRARGVYSAEVAVAAGLWAFAIYWFKPFHLYLALAHATPHTLRFSRNDVALFSSRRATSFDEIRKDAEKKWSVFCLLNASRAKHGGHAGNRAQRASG